MSGKDAGTRKVLHIIHGFGPGGVETWLLSAVKYLHQHPELNLRFDFLITGGEPRLFDEEIKSLGSSIFYNRYSNRSIKSFGKNLRHILKSHNYIAVHDHEDFISGWHFLLGGKYLPAVKVAHLHNPYSFVRNYVVNPLRWISFRVGRFLMAQHATALTGTSNAVMDEYGYNKRPYVEKRVAPVYCGFDTTRFAYDTHAKQSLCTELGWRDDVNIALFVGRIGMQTDDTVENQKNPAFALEVAKLLVMKNTSWRFVFVGHKGEAGKKMEREMNEQGLSEYIKFLDVRKDIPRIMSASDVFVFPSLWEGLGMVAVEAQCTGMKVVLSSAVPSEAIVCRELVTVKDLHDGAQAWVDSILATSTREVDRRQYSAEVKRSPFSIENSVHHLIHLYES